MNTLFQSRGESAASNAPAKSGHFIRLALCLWLAAALSAPSFSHAGWGSANFVVGDGSAASCTESAFDTQPGLAQVSGGSITFNCGGTATIVLTSQKFIVSTQPVVIDGGGQTTLDANSATRPFLLDTAAQLTLDGLTVRGGAAAGGGGGAVVRSGAQLIARHVTFTSNQTSGGSGGAISGDSGSSIMIDASAFTNNIAQNAGGAIQTNGTLTVSNSTFSHNSALAEGGAVALSGAAFITGTLFLSNTAENPAATGNGGALWSSGAVKVEYSQLLSNTADYGGGASVLTGTLAVRDSTIRGNVAMHYDPICDPTCMGGGGIAIRRGELLILGTLLERNEARQLTTGGSLTGNGGAVFSWDGNISIGFSTLRFNNASAAGGAVYAKRNISGGRGSADIANSWIFSNTASAGGGIVLLYTYYVQGGIQRSVFENNVASGGRGGALYDSAVPSSSLYNVTFLANSAGQGGAIYAEGNGDRWALNVTFSGNSAPYGGAISYYNGSTPSRYRLQAVTFDKNSSALAGGAIAVGVNGGAGTVELDKVAIAAGAQGVNCTVNTSSTISATTSYVSDGTCGAATLMASVALGPLVDDGPVVGAPGNRRRMPVHVPVAGSPLLDKAATCSTLTDQRDKPRPQDGDGNGNALCDIGAVERQPGDGTAGIFLPLVTR